MKLAVLLFIGFWVSRGIMIIKEEMEKEKSKLSETKMKEGIIILLKAMYYGPLTRSKVLANL